MSLLDNHSLENSPTVANCRMNREREIRGSNSYAADFGFDVIDLLVEKLKSTPSVRWLDLCCGTGRALIQAAEQFRGLGLDDRVSIVGVDLVNMFAPRSQNDSLLTLVTASAHDWSPNQKFDLLTCVHGLHYVGDKLGLIERATSWLQQDGLFVAHLDLKNLKLVSGKPMSAQLGRTFKQFGMKYDCRRRILSCHGIRKIAFPFRYTGADDEAGPNFTGQPAVDSYYEPLASNPAPGHLENPRDIADSRTP